MVNTYVRMRTYTHISKHTDSNSFSYLEYGSSTKASIMIPTTERITQGMLKPRFSSINEKEKQDVRASGMGLTH